MVVRKRLSCCFPFTMYLALLILDSFRSGSPFILHLGSTATECQEPLTQNNCPSISSCPPSLVSPNILSGLTDMQAGFILKVCVIEKSRQSPSQKYSIYKSSLRFKAHLQGCLLLCQLFWFATINSNDPFLVSVYTIRQPSETSSQSSSLQTLYDSLLLPPVPYCLPESSVSTLSLGPQSLGPGK